MIGVILAGGKGKRLGSLTSDIPKPLVNICGKPVMEHQINYLKENGISDILVLLGHKGDLIKEYFQDGSRLNVKISYCQETTPLGTSGSVKNAAEMINSPFVVLYGDVILDVDLQRAISFHNSKASIATLVVHPNSHPFDSDLLELSEENRVLRLLPKPRESGDYQNLVNAGMYILDNSIISMLPEGNSDFGKDIFPLLVSQGCKMYGYVTSEYIKDMGTPDRLENVEQDLLSGKVHRRNLRNKQKAIFLDRDGVINEEFHLISNKDSIKLIDGSAAAIKKINLSDYLCLVVTNQPVVARGLCSTKEVKEMHNRIDSLLGENGAFIDSYYYCPHHPDSGFPGENTKYKIKCRCRKPDIGMIESAIYQFNLDIKNCIIIGDTTTDIITGKNAGMEKTVLVKTGYGGSDNKYSAKPDFITENLFSAISSLFSSLQEYS